MGYLQSCTLKNTLKAVEHWTKQMLQVFQDSQLSTVLSRLLWIRGLNTVTVITLYGEAQHWLSDIRVRFHRMHVHPMMYDWAWFSRRNAVYARISLTEHYSYIGMTTCKVASREQGRMRKYKQIRQGTWTNVEPAVRWWAAKGSFFKYVPIVIKTAATRTSTAVWESHYIAEWQPRLNMPYIQAIMKEHLPTTSSNHQNEARYQRHRSGIKVWKKALKRDRKKKQMAYCLGKSQVGIQASHMRLQGFRLLHDLTSKTLLAYKASRRLRAWTTTTNQIYAVFRQAHMLEEPSRGKAVAAITKVMHYRCITVPKHALSPIVHSMAHETFARCTSTFLTTFVAKNANKFLPLHLPPTKIVEAAHKTIGKLLHNFKRKQTDWTTERPTTCRCREFLEKHPQAGRYEQHVATTGEELHNAPAAVRRILQACANDTVYPAKKAYLTQSTEAINKWSDHHAGPSLTEEWTAFVETQWTKHLDAAQNRNAHQFQDIVHTKQFLQDFVIHVEDHAAAKTVVYCPILYYALVHSTFTNTDIFTAHKSTPFTAKQAILEAIPDHIRKTYSWGIDCDADLAQSYIFPKRKKQWTNARPIITFAGTMLTKLWSSLATLLTEMNKIAYPESLHYRDVFQTFTDLKKFFKAHKHEFHSYIMDNDDLSGFFTSIPQSRIRKAIKHFLYRFDKVTKGKRQKVFTVMTKKGTTDGRVIRGRARTKSTSRQIWTKDIAELVELALTTSVFVSLGVVYSQSRGACMGCPVAPIICSIVVTVEEYYWRQSANTLYLSSTFMTRYVDNRLIISPEFVRRHPDMIRFTNLDFYVSPVSLENVDNDEVLGCIVSIAKGTIEHNTPTQSWQFRSMQSAGNRATLLSGLTARLHIICKCTFPRNSTVASIHRLTTQYIKFGYPQEMVMRTVFKIIRRYGISKQSIKKI